MIAKLLTLQPPELQGRLRHVGRIAHALLGSAGQRQIAQNRNDIVAAMPND
jgi:hypothetical protein